MTRAAALLAVGLLLASCTGPPTVTRPHQSGTAPGFKPASAPPASTGTRAEPITLVADLSARPARWRVVATIPFGEAEDQLGFLLDPNVGSLASVPTSFGVAGDGSIWILDDQKERLAHYAPGGRYLGQIGLSRGPGTTLRDVALTTAGMAVVHEIHPLSAGGGLRIDSRIQFIDVAGSSRTIVPRTGSAPVYVSLAFSGPDPQAHESVIGDVRALSDLSGSPTGRFAEFTPDASGNGSFRPGLPLDVDLWADVDATSEHDFDITFTRGSRTVTQPIHVRVVPSPDGRPLRAVVGPRIEVALTSEVGLLVQLQPSGERDADRYGSGRWYLQLGPANEPLVWEPIRYGSHQQERQVRHLTRGPGGSVYLMVLTRTGEVIYRRP